MIVNFEQFLEIKRELAENLSDNEKIGDNYGKEVLCREKGQKSWSI